MLDLAAGMNYTRPMSKAAFLAAAIALAGIAMKPAAAGTITLSPAADTALFELNPDDNFGGQGDLPAGTLGSLASDLRSRVLLKFDLAGSIPSNAVIHFAVLRLTVTKTPAGGGENSAFGLHRMLRDWGEGTKSGGPPGGAPATEGEAAWNARFHPEQLWGEPGGQVGVDYVAEASSTERIQLTGVYEFEFGAVQLAEITEWLRHPESNFGWMLRSQLEDEPRTARRFGAREHADPEARPQLRIEFSVPPVIAGITRGENGSEVRFTGESGVDYFLEAAATLTAPGWETVAGPVEISEGEGILVDDSAGGPRRFYRVAGVEGD